MRSWVRQSKLRNRSCTGFTILELLVVIAIVAVVLTLLLAGVQSVRESARRMTCSNNLRQIGLALHAYHDAFDTFPYAHVYSNNHAGKYVQQSWARQILSHLEQQTLYNAYNQNYGFAQGSNRDRLAISLPVYKCPTSPAPNIDEFELKGFPTADSTDPRGPLFYAGVAEYFVVSRWTGPSPPGMGSGRGMFPFHNEVAPSRPIRIVDVRDGLSNTIAVSENAGGGRVYRANRRSTELRQSSVQGHWAAHNRFDIIRYDTSGERRGGGHCVINCTNDNGRNFFGFHPGGVLALFGDGSSRFMNSGVEYETCAALCVIDDGRSVQLGQ